MPEELIGLFLSVGLGGYAIIHGVQLLGRTCESDPAKRWGCGRLAFAWFLWLLVCVLAVFSFLPNISCARGAARRAQCCNNLKQIGFALHNYHDRYGSFPPAYTIDASGRRLHSWRVLLLPFLEQQRLYERLRLDEPWDSPHNLGVFTSATSPDAKPVPMTIACYRCPSDPASQGETNYVMIVGPHTISNGPNSVRLKDIADGPANTIAVVETYGLGIRWYEPADLRAEEITFRINDPEYFGIASRHPGGVLVGLVDGTARFLPDCADPRAVEAATTIQGGEAGPSVLKDR